MAKYQDRFKTRIPAEICKYKKGEDAKDRHARRIQTNNEHADKLRNFCKSNGFSIDIKNEGQHWQIKHNGITIDWWPATAKLVVNQQFDKGIHVHDISQVIAYLIFTKLLIKPLKD